MATMKMTARSVEALRPPTVGQVDYWDADHPGFGLRVSAGGRKAWVAMYRHADVKRRLTIGTYPALSLAEAREKAAAAHHTVQYSGADPAAAKKAARAAETFAELADQYIERHAKRQKRSWHKDLLILGKDAIPRFGNRKAKDISRRDIIAMLDELVAHRSKRIARWRSSASCSIGRLGATSLGQIHVIACRNRRLRTAPTGC